MNLPTFTEEISIAKQKWHEYNAAARMSSNPLYKDLKKVYKEIKSGKKLLDITKAIAFGGIHTQGDYSRLPKLAIARADQKKIRCRVSTNGNCSFIHDGLPQRFDVIINNVLPKFTWTDNQNWRTKEGEAPLPMIPPKLLPNPLTEDYYILWEVDEWKMVPPTDPWLMRRITKTMFVVLSGWDLTELEKSVIAARL